MRSLRLSEAAMNRTNAELSHRAQQLETRLTVLEAELGKAREEVRRSSRRSKELKIIPHRLRAAHSETVCLAAWLKMLK